MENIRETILVESWTDEYWEAVGYESQILDQLNLNRRCFKKGYGNTDPQADP